MSKNEQMLPQIMVSAEDRAKLDEMIELREGPLPKVLEDLAAELDRAVIVPSGQMPADVVTMNATVRFVVEPSGQEFVRTLVYPHDAGGEGRISVGAPTGAALLGLRVGQSIPWPLPGDPAARVRVVGIVEPPALPGGGVP